MQPDQHPDVSHLPKSAQRLVALIGLPATAMLVEKHGGKDLTLYNRGDSIARIAAIIGEEAADKLFQFYGSDPFSVPLCSAALSAVRNAKIHADYDRLMRDERLSGREAIHRIVDVFHLSERQIKRILKKSSLPPVRKAKPVDTRQMTFL